MAGNAIITIEGNAAREAKEQQMGKNTYYCFSLAVHERRGSEDPPTWFQVNIAKDSRSEKVMSYIKAGSQCRVTGTLKVRPKDGPGAWLDVYVPIEMFAFTGMVNKDGTGGHANPPQAKRGDQQDAPKQAAAADGDDLPF
jgi:single-stranded DNA-binding protein